jgi:hypothetical protein
LNIPSRRWEIDQRIRALIGKLVRMDISRDEESELQMLQRERVSLMTPART